MDLSTELISRHIDQAFKEIEIEHGEATTEAAHRIFGMTLKLMMIECAVNSDIHPGKIILAVAHVFKALDNAADQVVADFQKQ